MKNFDLCFLERDTTLKADASFGLTQVDISASNNPETFDTHT